MWTWEMGAEGWGLDLEAWQGEGWNLGSSRGVAVSRMARCLPVSLTGHVDGCTGESPVPQLSDCSLMASSSIPESWRPLPVS